MLFLSCLYSFCVRLFIDALCSPAGKGLTSWLSFAVSNCEFVTFPLVSWFRCGAWLYRFVIFAFFLTIYIRKLESKRKRTNPGGMRWKTGVEKTPVGYICIVFNNKTSI